MISIFTPSIESVVGGTFIGFVDDAIALSLGVGVPLGAVLQGRGLRAIPGGWAFAVFIIMGIFSSVANGVPTEHALEAVLLAVKMPLLAFGIAQLDWSETDMRKIARLGVFLGLFVGLFVLVNGLVGRIWATVLSGQLNYVDYRYGLLSLQGPFSHPLVLGNFAAILVVMILSTRVLLPQIRWTRVALVAVCASVLFSFRRTAIAGAIAGATAALPTKYRGRAVLTFVILVPVVLLLLLDEIIATIQTTVFAYVEGAASAARSVLTIDSMHVANEHFPLGAGFARFGSYLASVHYSPEYVERGYPAIWGLGYEPGTGMFLTDTQWPAIIGESGWIGGAFFAIFLICILLQARRLASAQAVEDVWLGRVVIGVLIHLAIASLAVPVFTSTPVAPMFYMLVGCLGSRTASLAALKRPRLSTRPERVRTSVPYKSRNGLARED
ncbi:hypothetical protein [Salinibacterium sp. ZJ450]|uniref:hypothetical protein n=1 Tax=Salinibacterium sp. ZJ450 TaxID=2708338 RepID=UPI001421D88D|nr:hypothetical protein [Salinibacterium sp. ZJ450]